MIKPFFFLLAVATPFAASSAQQPQTTAAQQPTAAAQIAQGLQPMIGQKFEGDLTLAKVAAEANTVVLTISGPQGWRGTLSPEQISGALVEGFCSSAPKFFENGVTVRVDSIDSGRLIAGPLVSACK